jgi:ribosomal protein S18 acetylase RimI-like enzyme
MANQEMLTPGLIVRPAKAAELSIVEPLWVALYKHQKDHGMLLEVSPGSFEDWAASMKITLGRFSCLLVADFHGELIGFLAGSVKTLPPCFGGFPVGFISEVYVSEEHRGKNIGHSLMSLAAQWFAAQSVHRIELQVLLDNSGARKFYRDLGWKEELVQMIWEMSAK